MFDFEMFVSVHTLLVGEIFWHLQAGEVLGLRFMVLVLMARIILKLLEQPMKRGFLA